MAYRKDTDLEFLKECTNDDLAILFDILTKDIDGSVRWTEELTLNEKVKKHAPAHREYWDLIAAEIQCFGANTLTTILRGGEGVLYREVLTDVCDKMDISYNESNPVEAIELNLLLKILTDSLKSMNHEELKVIVDYFGLKTTDFSQSTPQEIESALRVLARNKDTIIYQIALIVANNVAKATLGRGLEFAANAGLVRVVGIFVPTISMFLTGLWSLLNVSGPKYRITIPCVVQVAYLRAKLKSEKA